MSHTSGGMDWNSLSAYAQRDIPSLRSQLILGDSFTSGQIFDSVGFRGASLGSDDRMLPQSLRGYAPTLRGVAATQARVQVWQSGNLIYETSVAPG
ncbi:fimbria/pilus outer membrane usher protein, partial [Stenotrophomonas sp. GbtcB23]|uniref:fimbria/pilus outer membrane usher protein n=1 Tax=Stenotrophomonas sp. GbtcB23 TaxID=2824768 RepID=UPI0020C5EBE1